MITNNSVGASEHKFPLWEIILVAVFVLIIAWVILSYLGTVPSLIGNQSPVTNLTTAEQQAEFLKRLNQPSTASPMTPAQEAEFLKRLNQPVKNQMTPEQEAEFLKRLSQPVQPATAP